jgi:hypothetical protein
MSRRGEGDNKPLPLFFGGQHLNCSYFSGILVEVNLQSNRPLWSKFMDWFDKQEFFAYRNLLHGNGLLCQIFTKSEAEKIISWLRENEVDVHDRTYA